MSSRQQPMNDVRAGPRSRGGEPAGITDDLAYLRTAIVNVVLFGAAGSPDWTLIDAGLFGSGDAIRAAAKARFADVPPRSIILTHGHFDHIGAVRELATAWDVEVFAHPLELPYLTGRSSYPPPDPGVGGGAMARMAWAFPRAPIDLGMRVRPLPEDGTVPGMPGWRWVHTPGHTPGHVALFRDADRALIAGDAAITVRQESIFAVLAQRPELHGPPAYYTPDWSSAESSVRRLAQLEPRLLIGGHGVPLRGDGLPAKMRDLADSFREREVPDGGRYVDAPATADESGVTWVPPRPRRRMSRVLLGGGAALLLFALSRRRRGRDG